MGNKNEGYLGGIMGGESRVGSGGGGLKSTGILSLEEAGTQVVDPYEATASSLSLTDGLTLVSGTEVDHTAGSNGSEDAYITLPTGSGYVYAEVHMYAVDEASIWQAVGLIKAASVDTNDVGQTAQANAVTVRRYGTSHFRHIGGTTLVPQTVSGRAAVNTYHFLANRDNGNVWIGITPDGSTTRWIRSDNTMNATWSASHPTFSGLDLSVYDTFYFQQYYTTQSAWVNFGGNPLFNGQLSSGNDSSTWFRDPDASVSASSFTSGPAETLTLPQLSWGGITGRSVTTKNPSSLHLNFDGQLSSYTRATTSPTAPKANGDQLATSIVAQNKTGSVQSKYMGPNGKLINGYVDNLVPHSTDFSTSAGWTHVDNPSLTTGQADPFGGTNATTIGDTDSTGFSSVEYIATPGNDLVLTASIFIKKQSNTITNQVCLFRILTGPTTGIAELQIKPQDGSYNLVDLLGVQYAILEATREDFGDWWRFSVTVGHPNYIPTSYAYMFFPDVGTSFVNVGSNYSSTGTGAATIFGAQFEVAGAPSQYVSSTASPAQVPRVEFDASGNPLGLLVEEGRTNIYPGTIPVNNSITFTANQGVAPDGTYTAIKATEDNALGEKNAGTPQFSVTNGTQYTLSLFAKPAGRPGIRLLLPSIAFVKDHVATYDLQGNGSILEWTGSNAPDATTITPAGNGWYRISITGTAASNSSAAYLQLVIDDDGTNTNTVYQGNGSSGLLIWGIQVEAGAGPTSLITANSTRTADDITLSTSSFGYSTPEGTALVDFSVQRESSGSSGVFRFDDGSSTNLEELYATAAGALTYSSKETNATTWTLESGLTEPFSRAVAVRHQGTSAKAAVDGTLGSTQTLTTAPTTTRTTLYIGNAGSNAMNGHIRSFSYWPVAVRDVELSDFTTAPTSLPATSQSLVNTGIFTLEEIYELTKST